MTDGRCRFGPRAKREMVARVLAGEHARAIARSIGCSPSTVTAARDRWLAAGEAERASGAWCAPRRPVPRSCPWGLSPQAEQAILQARAKSNWGPMRLSWLTGRHRSTIWKVLKRHGVNQQRRTQRPQTTRRYEWAEAGALLHIDAFELPKFDRPGHWAHGDRAERHRTPGRPGQGHRRHRRSHPPGLLRAARWRDRHHGLGHALTRAVQWFTEQGCGPLQTVMSDNAKCYAQSHRFAATLRELGARHILIPPRTPRWNGKIERFFRTLDTEWAHSRVWPNSSQRDRALSSFLRFYG